MNRKIQLGILFGSRSCEHEVSIVSALQLAARANPFKYDVIPVYITQKGEWYIGGALWKLETYRHFDPRKSKLTRVFPDITAGSGALMAFKRRGLFKDEQRYAAARLDCVIPVLHGAHGEDGSIAGLLELMDLPYAASGIAEAAKKAGAEVLFLDRTRFRETAIGGDRIKSIPIHPAILECDLVLNVPVVKHHRLATATLCMKNYMGVIEKRNLFHQAIPECLVDITRFMKPQICVLDAVRILTDHGPKGGDLKDVAMPLALAAGTDIVALDAWGAEVLGLKVADVPSIGLGEAAGLGRSDYRSLALKEIAVS